MKVEVSGSALIIASLIIILSLSGGAYAGYIYATNQWRESLAEVSTVLDELKDMNERIIQLADDLDKITDDVQGLSNASGDLWAAIEYLQTEIDVLMEKSERTSKEAEFEFTPVNFTEFREVDPDGVIDVNTSSRIDWANMNRSLERRLFKDFRPKQFGDFMHIFEFGLREIEAGDESNRQSVVLWEISTTNASARGRDSSFMHIYAEQIHSSNETFNLVFNQKIDGYNTMVYFRLLSVGKTYYATVMREGSTCRIIVYNDLGRTNITFDSGYLVCEPTRYDYLLLIKTSVYTEDFEDWSTGYLQNLSIQP